jgi:hypothetical protein
MNINVAEPIEFITSVFLPPQAAFMAFTYKGQVYAAEGENPTTIWSDPVVR